MHMREDKEHPHKYRKLFCFLRPIKVAVLAAGAVVVERLRWVGKRIHACYKRFAVVQPVLGTIVVASVCIAGYVLHHHSDAIAMATVKLSAAEILAHTKPDTVLEQYSEETPAVPSVAVSADSMITEALDAPQPSNQPEVIPASTNESAVAFDFVAADEVVEYIEPWPPEATAVNRDAWEGLPLRAIDFLKDINAAGDVTARFKTSPDWSVLGTQNVVVVLEDTHGHSVEFSARVTIKEDTDPPVIRGAIDRHVHAGDSISYRDGVTAWDNKDGNVALSIDSSAVNINSAGVYPVVYSAVDSSGYATSVTVYITVFVVDAEYVYSLADGVLAGITTPDMSLTQKAKAIHTWVRNNIIYISKSDKSSTIRSAYIGMSNRRGDCFVFYAVAEVLLTRAGVPNTRITRLGGATEHHWNLINVGTGWYHFDATNVAVIRARDTFMFTDEQAVLWSPSMNARGDFYYYDRTKYPPIVGQVPIEGLEPLPDPIDELEADEQDELDEDINAEDTVSDQPNLESTPNDDFEGD